MQYHQLIRHNGIEPLFHAIEMSVIAACNHLPFHLHAEGLRGTGKTTALRAAHALLPPIERIKGCIYNCDPKNPHCPQHKNLTQEEIATIGTEFVPRPFLEISHSAKIASVVGSIDLSKLVNSENSTAALLPGTIPQAHRGIIFVDEINRLADTSPELADILLDVMGTKPGRIQIEEAGLPIVEMPVEVSIWAASNPDEEPGRLADVRRQLSDRFDLTIPVKQPSDVTSVQRILNQTSPDTELFQTFSIPKLDNISFHDDLQQILATIYVQFNLESIRSIQAIETSSRLEAAISQRDTAQIDDIIKAILPTLSHRVSTQTIEQILHYLDLIRSHQEIPFSLSAGVIAEHTPKPTIKKFSLSRLQQLLKQLIKLFPKFPSMSDLTANTKRNEDPSHHQPQLKTSTKEDIISPPKTATPLSELKEADWLKNPEEK